MMGAAKLPRKDSLPLMATVCRRWVLGTYILPASSGVGCTVAPPAGSGVVRHLLNIFLHYEVSSALPSVL